MRSRIYYIKKLTIKIATFCLPFLGYVVRPNYFASALKKLPMFYDKKYAEENQSKQSFDEMPMPYRDFPELVMP